MSLLQTISCLQKLLQFNLWKTRIPIENILAFTLNKSVILKNKNIYASREAPRDLYVLKLENK